MRSRRAPRCGAGRHDRFAFDQQRICLRIRLRRRPDRIVRDPAGGQMMQTDDRSAMRAKFAPPTEKPKHSGMSRRSLLATAALLVTTSGATAKVITKVLPWRPNEVYPVTPVVPGGWLFFTADEAALVDAIVDRLIPTDELGPGAKDSGVTTFIDRQLTG